MERPLAGIRVIDFSRYLPGPFCSLQLSWLGAEVTSVEQPPAGDPIRAMPPIGPDGQSAAGTSLHRSKEQLLADLSEPDQLERVVQLCADADVVIESFRPGVAERLGIGPVRLREQHPPLVYCSISGYGQTGPWAQRAGHDANYLSVAGVLDLCGTREQPTLPPVPLADLAGGWAAATAICASLLQRERSGTGTHLDVSLTEAALSLMTMHLPQETLAGTGRGRGMLNGGMACYSLYRCADERWLAVAAVEPKFFARLCELVGRPELAADQYDATKQELLRSELDRIFIGQPSAHWQQLLEDDETCTTVVRTAAEVAGHPQLTARKAVEPLYESEPRVVAPAAAPFYEI